jgi:hypothetical protein
MAERGVEVDHSTIARWVLHFSPILNDLIRREMRRPNRSWRVDETYVRAAGRWTHLYRAIDSIGKHHRLSAFFRSGSDCGERLSAAGPECRTGPTASHQC